LSVKTIFYSALLIGVIYLMFTTGFPILLAFVLAFLIEPIVQKLTALTKLKRAVVSVAFCIIVTVLFIILVYLTVSFITGEALSLINTLSKMVRNGSSEVQNLFAEYQDIFDNLPLNTQQDIQNLLLTLSQWIQKALISLASVTLNVAKGLPYALVDLVIFFIAFFLFSFNLPSLRPAFLNFFNAEAHENVNLVLNKLSNAIYGFLGSQVIIFIAMYLALLVGFLILGIKYASALALAVAIIDILPILGAGAVLIPMSIYMFVTGKFFLGIGVLILYVFIIAYRRVIETKVLSVSVGIGSLPTLISMYLGFKLAGLVGLFMGPLTVLLFQTLVNVGIIKININFDDNPKGK